MAIKPEAYFIFIRISLLEKNKSYEPSALYLLLPKWNTEMKEGILMIANYWLSELLLAAWEKKVWEPWAIILQLSYFCHCEPLQGSDSG